MSVGLDPCAYSHTQGEAIKLKAEGKLPTTEEACELLAKQVRKSDKDWGPRKQKRKLYT